MSERLTDEELAKWSSDTWSTSVRQIANELIDRRSRDLSGDDLVALNGIRAEIEYAIETSDDPSNWRRQALEVVDRIIKNGLNRSGK